MNANDFSDEQMLSAMASLVDMMHKGAMTDFTSETVIAGSMSLNNATRQYIELFVDNFIKPERPFCTYCGTTAVHGPKEHRPVYVLGCTEHACYCGRTFECEYLLAMNFDESAKEEKTAEHYRQS